MKKTVLYVLVVIFAMCIFFTSCNKKASSITETSTVTDTAVQSMNSKVSLIVNGNDLSYVNYVSLNYEKQYAELPLTAIMEALGANVEWVSEKNVSIVFNNTKYVLNPKKKTLKKEGDSFNIIALPPGTKHGGYYQIRDKEFIVDSDSARHFIYMTGAKITIDFDSASIKIDFDKKT